MVTSVHTAIVGIQPPIPRLMAFIDGENLVARYQAMLNNGRTARPDVVHKRDVYVWSPVMRLDGHYHIVRAYYYASHVGDVDAVSQVSRELKETRFAVDDFNSRFNWLYPIVFKKPSAKPKTTMVDVRLTTDLLSHVHQNNVDVVLLYSGDSDYCAVIEEATARGKQLVVAAFSSGLSPELRARADRFIDLDEVYFVQTDFSRGTPFVGRLQA
jgi:uncharacterized LabA/DUF88 family protein